MARRHFRFTVRDKYGFAIQNARVNIYLPGTTTVFSGSAYNADSGGSTVTNPFTTNAQGEIEAWFDNAQSVDVAVDDNGDTAYRAAEGSGSPISFTAVTERDEIHVDPADAAINPGESGDLVAAIVNPFTAVTAAAGSTGEYADAGHTHPFTALTPAAAEDPRSVAGAGTGTDPAREDHIHGFASATSKTSKFTTTSDTNEQLIHSLSVPASVLAAGSVFRIQLMAHQTNSTTAITFTFRVRWGGLAGTQLHSIAFVGTTTAHTDNPVHLNYLVNFQSIGGSGTAVTQVQGDECITTATANTPKLVVDPQTTAVGSLDTTTTKDLSLTVQMSATTGTPQVEVDNVLIEQVA